MVPNHLQPQGQYTFTEFLLDRGRFHNRNRISGACEDTLCGL